MSTSGNLINSVLPGDLAEGVIEMKSGETVGVNGEDTNSRMEERDLGSRNGVMNEDRLQAYRTTVDGVVIERVILINSGEAGSVDEEDGDLRAKNEGLGFSDGVSNGETLDRDETDENSSNSVDGVVPETLMVINSQTVCDLVLKKTEGKKVAGMEEHSCVIDVKLGDGGGAGAGAGIRQSWEGEKVCRICHLSTDGSLENIVARMTSNVHMTAASMDLIQLGCGCKDELGIAHVHCAEAWFKLKGNRLCEICGQAAKNVTGAGDNIFMEEWNGRRYARNYSNSSEGGEGCWQGQPFCNFLMACLVIAFVLPWFFRVDLF